MTIMGFIGFLIVMAWIKENAREEGRKEALRKSGKANLD